MFLTLCLYLPAAAIPAWGTAPPAWAPNPYSVALLGMLDRMGLLDEYRWYESELYPDLNGHDMHGVAAGMLNGLWLAGDHTLIGFRVPYARIFDGTDRYQDFRVRIHGRQLLFKGLYVGSVRRYDFRRSGRHLWLRDQFGNLRHFVRIR